MDEARIGDVYFLLNVLANAEPGWGEELLLPWFEERPKIVEELHDIGRAESHKRQFPRTEGITLPGLYALNRLVDVLISAHQPVNDDPELLSWTTGKPWWQGQVPRAGTWPAFARAVGATAISEDEFHPFFHEIVAVEAAEDPNQPPRLAGEFWPGALVGNLLLVRSGVSVNAGTNYLTPDVAARSRLYWTWWRRNRPVDDLSHGWGGNSQWDTDFRRDYLVDGYLHYNVEASYRTPKTAQGGFDLTRDERHDLLKYRHSTKRDLGPNQFPYYYALVERWK